MGLPTPTDRLPLVSFRLPFRLHFHSTPLPAIFLFCHASPDFFNFVIIDMLQTVNGYAG